MTISNGLSRTMGDLTKMVAGLGPIAGTGAAQNGAWVDRSNFFAVMVPMLVQLAGGATGGTVTFQLQDATSIAGAGASNFGSSYVRTIGTGPNEQIAEEFVRSLDGARQFIRVVATVAPTGGTPTSIVAAPMILMAPNKVPV